MRIVKVPADFEIQYYDIQEYANKKNGNAFYWSGDESLEELEKPERISQIIENGEKQRERSRKNATTLVGILGGREEEEEEREGCLICQI